MGIAYLPDGSLIDYGEYIAKHPHWQKIRKARFDFDDGRCVICHNLSEARRALAETDRYDVIRVIA